MCSEECSGKKYIAIAHWTLIGAHHFAVRQKKPFPARYDFEGHLVKVTAHALCPAGRLHRGHIPNGEASEASSSSSSALLSLYLSHNPV